MIIVLKYNILLSNVVEYNQKMENTHTLIL